MTDSPQRLPWWPAPQRPAPRGRGDWALLCVAVALGVIEVVARPELKVTSPEALIGFALMPTILWRRHRPLWTVTITFGAAALLTLSKVVFGSLGAPANAMIFMLVHPYALLRWGKRRDVILGTAVMLAGATFGILEEGAKLGEVLGGYAVLSITMSVGLSFRFRDHARHRELEQVKAQEREHLARELHDTVAHHVSAIAIRAQAGLAVAATKPEAAAEALKVIEGEASRTLGEMRAMVRLLRSDAELAPAPRLEELADLAAERGEGPAVEVALAGDVDDVAAPVAAAIYRLAQESVTNARRHARRATLIDVGVTVDDSTVHLRVTDDGDKVRGRTKDAGYGLLGMSERAALLGGSCEAGPNPERGWTVTAALPRHGPTP